MTDTQQAGNGKTLGEHMAEVKNFVDGKYLAEADKIRAIADEFRGRAEYLEKLADQVLERAEMVKAEVDSAVDFHSSAAKSALFLRELLNKMTVGSAG